MFDQENIIVTTINIPFYTWGYFYVICMPMDDSSSKPIEKVSNQGKCQGGIRNVV